MAQEKANKRNNKDNTQNSTSTIPQLVDTPQVSRNMADADLATRPLTEDHGTNRTPTESQRKTKISIPRKKTDGPNHDESLESNTAGDPKPFPQAPRLKGPVGVDFGTSRIVVASGMDGIRTESQLNAFYTVPYSRFTERVLTRHDITFEKRNDNLTVYGNDAQLFANMCHADLLRPMQLGVINPQEVSAYELIQKVASLVVHKPEEVGQTLWFSIPAKPVDSHLDPIYHEAVMMRHLASLGYDVSSINEAFAVILSELEDTDFTGVGISCGGGMCNVCFSYMSIPIFSFSIARGGDFIDEGVAQTCSNSRNTVRNFKENSFQLNRDPKGTMEQALHVYYNNLIRYLVQHLQEQFARTDKLPNTNDPIVIVLAGGTAKLKGFLDNFRLVLDDMGGLPFRIKEVRLASDLMAVTARGARVAAEENLL